MYQVRLVGLALVVGVASPAFAHISLEQGGTHMSRYGDGVLKDGPCGMAGGTRGTHIYTYAPGSTITVSLVETIAHPSYFRFAFDANGDSAFKEPASILPIDPTRMCPVIDTSMYHQVDHCTKSDFCNNSAVLLDNLDPHLAGKAGPKFTWQVKLPNIECDNCTLQVIQVMEDPGGHGPYDPTPASGPANDIYHQCIDLVLKKGAPNGNGTIGSGNATGIVCANGSGADGGSGGGGGGGGTGGNGGGGGGEGGNGGGGGAGGKSGGCGIAGGDVASPAALGLALVGLGLVTRRRRRA